MRFYVALSLTLGVCLAQKPVDPAATFEVASVKAVGSGADASFDMFRTHGGPGSDDPGHFRFSGPPLRFILVTAYDVRRDQISGPAWMDSERFDIVAKFPPDTSHEQFLVMLQNLLKERFQMTVRSETKTEKVYALVAGKHGFKGKSSAGTGQALCEVGESDGPGMHRVCKNMTMAELAAILPGLAPRFVDAPVSDATGLQGKFDFKLDWVPLALAATDGGSADRPDGLTLFDSLDRNLGLRLEPRKGPVVHYTIEKIEKTPIGN